MDQLGGEMLVGAWRSGARARGLGLVAALLAGVLVALPRVALGARGPGAGPSGRGGPASAGELEAFLDGFMDQQMSELQVPSAVFSFVRDGEPLLSKGWGLADPKAGIAADPARTVYRVASISKVFTATAIMQLYERGLVDLNDDVNRYLTSMQIAKGFGAPVRLWHLLSHTAGFDERLVGIAARTPKELSLRRFLQAYQPSRVLPPGDQISYSNYGNCLLGLVVEEVTGMPFEVYAREHLLAPLGMRDSSFVLPERLRARLAKGFVRKGNRLEEVPQFYVNMTPASTLVSTADDMARFLMAHLSGGRVDGGPPILAPATVARMHSQLFSQHPDLAGNAHGFWERFINGRRTLEHGGVWFGYESLLVLIPGEGDGFFLSHTGGDVRLRARLLEALFDRFYPSPPLALPPTLPIEDAERYAGSYVWNRYARKTFEKAVSLTDGWTIRVRDLPDGSLMVHYPGDLAPPRRFLPVATNLFRRVDGEDSIAFRTNANGEVTHIFAHVFDLPMVGERVPAFLTPEFQLPFGVASLAVVLSAALVVPWFMIWRRRRGIEVSAVIRWAEWTALAVVATFLAFGVGLVIILGPPRFVDPVFGVPDGIDLVLSIPLLALPLTGTLLLLVAAKWLWSYGSILRRAYFTLVAGACVGFTLFLAHINWLGP